MKTESSQLLQMLRLEMRDNGKKYLMWIGIILIAMAALTCFASINCYNQYKHPMRFGSAPFSDPMAIFMNVIFWIGFLFASCIFAAQVCAPLGTKGGAISYLMIPATQLDKYLARWILFVPMFIIVYVVCFELIDLTRYLSLWLQLPVKERLHLVGFSFMPNDPMDIGYAIALPLLLSSFFVLGSSIWPKRGFIYTALWLGALVALCAILAGMYFSFLMSNDNQSLPIMHSRLNQDALGWTVIALAIFGALANYTLAYFRFKESEIIQRW